jgi:hypothetical protein
MIRRSASARGGGEHGREWVSVLIIDESMCSNNREIRFLRSERLNRMSLNKVFHRHMTAEHFHILCKGEG